jgi:2-aminoadipate transaminase
VTADRLAARAALMRPSALRELLSEGTPPRLSLAGGLPPAEAFPFDVVGEIVADLMAAHDVSALQYTSAEGDPRLRALVAERVGAELGRPVGAADVIVATGTQQAIDLVGRVLLDPGDVAVVESPTYVGALRSIAPTEARIVGVRGDADGMDTERLAALLAGGTRPKLVYLVANFSNPSGATLSAPRRAHLAALADEFGFVVVEDDQYGRLRFRGTHLAPIASMTEQAVYISGFSKVVAPGLRVGYLVAPSWLTRPLVLAKQATDLAASSLGQRIVTRMLERDGWLDQHVEHLRDVYRERAAALLGAAGEQLAGRLILNEPEGGMFTWARIEQEGVDASAAVTAARAEGLAIVPGNEFSIDGGYDRDLRLSYSTLTPAELIEAVGLLRAAFDRLA